MPVQWTWLWGFATNSSAAGKALYLVGIILVASAWPILQEMSYTGAMPRRLQLFQVGIKAIFLRRGSLLVVRESAGPQYWELPGGRFDVGEHRLNPEDVLRREIREELGPALRYRIGDPIRAWIRPPSPLRKHPAFLLGFRCTPVSGEIRLSDEHCEYRWVDRASWRECPLAPGYESVIRSLIARR